MRILLHDYSGHPFQAQLSRELARRGHHVWHVTSADFQTPKGRLAAEDDYQGRLRSLRLSLGEVFQKDSFVKRRSQEAAFGRLVAAEIGRIRPDLVLSSNAPLDTQVSIQRAARRVDAGFVFWVQDLYGEAISRIMRTKLGMAGHAVGAYYKSLEYRMLRTSDAVVVISADFEPILRRNGVSADSITVIENWAPLDEMRYRPARQAPPGDTTRFLYSGTLGYKHNPDFLTAVAELPGIDVVVHSEGRVANELRAAEPGLPNFAVKPWVPFEQLSETLASADVLMAMIEADAGVFSVPSKVLSYLCMGRPILASIPDENLAARILRESGAGLVSAPGDIASFLENARRLASSPDLREAMGRKARVYAESTFDIGPIGDRFERLFHEVLPRADLQAA